LHAVLSLTLFFASIAFPSSAEYEDICEAAYQARNVSQLQAWRNLFKKQYRPSLVLAVMIPTFQQWTG
jgi:hypothetical protein